MQFGLADRALEAQQQTVIEIVRIIQTALVQDQRVAQRAQLEQPVPVAVVAGQTRDFQAEHDADVVHRHLGHKPLKTGAIHRRCARLPEVRVDCLDLRGRPAQRQGALAQGILPPGTLLIFKHLSRRGLADVEQRDTREVARGDLGWCARVTS